MNIFLNLEQQLDLFNNLYDPLIITDMQFRIIKWNIAAERVYGWQADEVMGQVLSDIVESTYPHETRTAVISQFQADGFWQGEVIQQRRDGKALYIWSVVSLIKDEAGTAVAIVGINRDMTSRKQAEQDLRDRLELERLIAAVANDFINLPWEQVDQGINQTLKTLAEFAGAVRCSVFLFHDELTHATNTHEWVADPADSQMALVQNRPIRTMKLTMMRFMAGEKVIISSEDDLAQLPGMKAWMEAYGFQSLVFVPMFAQGELYGAIGFYGPSGEAITWPDIFVTMLEFVASIIVNAIERKRAAARLQAYAAELERSNEELQEFAYVASHDLQEPLRKVQAFGGRLRHRYHDQLDERGQDYLYRMERAAVRMEALLDGLLVYSRVQTRAKPFKKVDLTTVVSGVVSDLEAQVDRVNGRVYFPKLPTIQADPIQMRQLFQNLLSNALKFHKVDTPPEVEITAKPLWVDSQELIEISITDNGIGFEQKYAERIFGVFQRLHGRYEYEGSGLGLAISRKIVLRHNGRIFAQSAPGRGTTFMMQLPVRQKMV